MLATISSALWGVWTAYFPPSESSQRLDAWIEQARKEGFVSCRMREMVNAHQIFEEGRVVPGEQTFREELLGRFQSEEAESAIRKLPLPCTFNEDGEVVFQDFKPREALAKTYGLRDSFKVNLIQDMLFADKTQRLDARLASYYQEEYDAAKNFLSQNGCSEEKIEQEAKELAKEACEEIRKRIFGETFSFFGGRHNRVEGTRDYMIVLKKNADACIGSITDRGDIGFLAPYQNSGEFFSLNLKNDPNLIIVAPRDVVKVWQGHYSNLFAHEDLTESQKLFFYHT